jgi:hypothetical protein
MKICLSVIAVAIQSAMPCVGMITWELLSKRILGFAGGVSEDPLSLSTLILSNQSPQLRVYHGKFVNSAIMLRNQLAYV